MGKSFSIKGYGKQEQLLNPRQFGQFMNRLGEARKDVDAEIEVWNTHGSVLKNGDRV
jgi:hypothetical protein